MSVSFWREMAGWQVFWGERGFGGKREDTETRERVFEVKRIFGGERILWWEWVDTNNSWITRFWCWLEQVYFWKDLVVLERNIFKRGTYLREERILEKVGVVAGNSWRTHFCRKTARECTGNLCTTSVPNVASQLALLNSQLFSFVQLLQSQFPFSTPELLPYAHDWQQ